jgi:hypothetical protein
MAANLASGSTTALVTGTITAETTKYKPKFAFANRTLAGTTTLYTVPAGKKAYLTSVKISIPTATTASTIITVAGVNIYSIIYAIATAIAVNETTKWAIEAAPELVAGETVTFTDSSGASTNVYIEYVEVDA